MITNQPEGSQIAPAGHELKKLCGPKKRQIPMSRSKLTMEANRQRHSRTPEAGAMENYGQGRSLKKAEAQSKQGTSFIDKAGTFYCFFPEGFLIVVDHGC